MKIKHIITTLLLTASLSQAAVTLTIKSWAEASINGASNGLPIVNALGNAIPSTANSAYAVAGYFSTLPDFATATAVQILGAFVTVDSIGTNAGTANSVAVNASLAGLFNGQDFNEAAATSYPVAFNSKPIYVIVGNMADVKNAATHIAVFNTGSTFGSGFGAGGGAQTVILGTNSVYGNVVPLAGDQPRQGATPSTFANGIQLISAPVPETSTSLLGALGALALLRRRRN